MKHTIALAAMALTALCANAQAPKADDKAGCVPPPKELVVKELEPGSGDRVVIANSAVLVTYTGWLYDGCAKDLKGEQFDTSVGRSTPFGFMVGVGKVIKGWDEGILGMKEKEAKRLLVIPPDKAYGDRGAPGGKIPPNSTLVFEVQTIQIVYYPQAAPAAPAAPAPAAPAAPAAPKSK